MQRTTIVFPTDLLQRMKIVTRQKGTTISTFVRQAVETALEQEEAANREQVYAGLQTLKGLASAETKEQARDATPQAPVAHDARGADEA